MQIGACVDYKALRKINPEAARRAVLEYLTTNNHNITDTARVFVINRSVIYDILKKEKEGNLKDQLSRPKNSPKQTMMSFTFQESLKLKLTRIFWMKP